MKVLNATERFVLRCALKRQIEACERILTGASEDMVLTKRNVEEELEIAQSMLFAVDNPKYSNYQFGREKDA